MISRYGGEFIDVKVLSLATALSAIDEGWIRVDRKCPAIRRKVLGLARFGAAGS